MFDVADLARRLYASTSTLQRAFHCAFAISIRDYQRVLRVLMALEHVPTDKVDAVAIEVGCKSRKNFCRALRRITGLTPSGFRALSGADAAKLIDSVKLTLVRKRLT